MPAHIYEYAGVSLYVDYVVNVEDNIPTINSIRVLDANYAPCGPDLVDWLQRLVFMHTVTNGEAMLSVIVGELYDAANSH